MSVSRYYLGLTALLLCMVAVMVAMFSVAYVAPESVVQVVTEQVIETAPVPASVTPTPAPVVEVVYPTTLANTATDRYPASTLWGIAVRECGNGQRWTDILLLNNLERPEDLQPGIVKLPLDCTLHGKPIQAPSTKSNLVSKVSTPAPDLKVSESKIAPVTTSRKGPQAEIEDPPELSAEADLRISVMFDCEKSRPTSATPDGKYFERWIAQCGGTFFTGPGVNEDVELFDESGTITRTRVSDYQIRRAAELKERMDYLWKLVARNPERNAVAMGMIRLSYHGDLTRPGLKNITTLTWVDADYVLSFAEDNLEIYTDSWVQEQRRQGAFFAPFWRQVFSYTVPATKIAEPEEKPVDALAAGS